jgi:glucosamine kinase
VPYYLGIDGGGTKTTCAVGDESRLLATSVTGPSNIVRVGEAQARQSLQQCVRQACAAAGIGPDQVAHTCVGGSGASRPELAEMVRRFLAEIISTPIDVVGDMQIALEAAFQEGPGVIVIAGTGSIAYGRDRQGMTARAGGWGFAIGDEGSAHWIGREAVRAVLRASDRSQEIPLHSEFAAALCETWKATSLTELARIANSVPPPDFATLFPIVSTSKDSLAAQILANAGKELAQIATVVIDRLFASNDAAAVPVGMIGGVFRHSARTREDFYNELHRLEPRVEINPAIVDPVNGALNMARKTATCG